MPEASSTRLDRILHMLPLAAREAGVSIQHLAEALGCTAAEIVADLNEITEREFYRPGGSVDPLQILIERDRVRVFTTGEFKRPVRLSPRETLALGLGLRMLAAEAHAEEREYLLELASSLEAALATPPMDELRGPAPRYSVREERRAPSLELAPPTPLLFDDEARGDDLLPIVADAIRDRRRLRLRYVKPGIATPEVRDVSPYRLVHSEGEWYVLAHDNDRNAMRSFRMDRALDAAPTGETFDMPASFDPRTYVSADGKLFWSRDEEDAWVRYSPRIARWIVERTGIPADADGSVTIRHRVADARWLVRHVLQYGAEAEVVEPASLRERTRQVAETLAASA
jgi:predicted DNA-binding transcriptional regulator YafY